MTRELKKQLRAIAEDANIKARPEWLKSSREQLLTQISNTTTEKPEISPRTAVFELSNLFLPRNFVAVMRPVMAVILAIGVTAGGWIAGVSATENCLPGEMCYGVKMATEKTREFVVAVTADKSSEAHLHLEFAAKRAVEAKQVLEKQAPDAVEQASVAIDHLNKSLVSAGDSLKQAVDSNPQDAVSISKDASEKSKEIVDTLKEVDAKTVADTDLKKEVLESSKLAKATSIDTLAMVVKKQAEGETKVNAEEVKTLVQDKIKEMIVDAEAVKTQASASVGKLPETTSTTLTLTPIMAELATSMATSSPILIVTSTTDTPIASDKTVIVVSSTQAVILPPTIVKTFVDQAMVKVGENAETAKTGAEKATDYANNNQLIQAVEKIREVTSATTNAETVISNVNQVVKEVIPVVTVVPAVVSSTSTGAVAPSSTLKTSTTTITPKASQ